MSVRSHRTLSTLAAALTLGAAWLGQPIAAFAQLQPGEEFRVNSYTTNLQYRTSLASQPDGSFVVVWNSRDQDGDDWGVFGQRYDADGVPLGGEFQVNTYTTGGQRFGAVAADADGNFVVFWSSARPGGFTVVGQRYDAVGNSVGEEFRASSGPQYGISDPAVATDADNDFVVVWTDDTAIFGRRFDAAGTPVGADFHISQESFGNTQYTPAIAVGQSGEFVVVWTSA